MDCGRCRLPALVALSELREWLEEATPGAKRIYHRGFLAVDRVVTEMVEGQLKDRYIEPYDHIGSLVRSAIDAGTVTAYQKRLAEWEYEYWVEKL